LEVVAIKD